MKSQSSLARTGIIGTVLTLLALTAIIGYRSIPSLRPAAEYHALFTDASALKSGDDVQLAGMRVGEVTSVKLDGTRVRVGFTVGDRRDLLGEQTRLAIKVGTVLGHRYLELLPNGRCCLDAATEIPLERTTSGFDVTDSLGELARTVGDTHLPDLSKALDVTADLADAADPALRDALEGLRRLSVAVTARDDEFISLLTYSNNFSGILARRNAQLVSLFTDGNALLTELNARSAAIHEVLVQGQLVAAQLTGLANDNEKLLSPSLAELKRTLDLLNRNQANINDAISGVSNFATQLNDIVANGPFFSALIHNVLPANLRGQQPLSPGGPR